MPNTSVVVVGSGVAGLTAARTLVDNWPKAKGQLSVVVLEAGHRIGGRTYTNRSIPGWGDITGGEADIGASWIHGSCHNNPITRIKDALHLATFVTNDDLMDLRRVGGREVRDDKYDDYEALLEAAEARAKHKSHDLSVWDAMEGLKEGGGRDNPLMQYHMGNALEFNVGSSPHTLSAKYFNNDEEYKGKETLLARGYSQIPEALAEGAVSLAVGEDDAAPDVKAVSAHRHALDVRLGKRVSRISGKGRSLNVTTQGGETFKADHVIVTVPLGALKKGTIKFSPPLPGKMTTAISRIGFGNVVKIGILFDEVFWKQDQHYFGLVHDEPDMSRAEKFTYFLNAAPAVGKPVLFTFAFGDSAWEVETWSDEQVWSAISENLVAMFGRQDLLDAKVAMWRSRWGHEDDFWGAYSYAAVGSQPADWEALGEVAAGGRLHFAGEHTSADYRGTVHGAFLSGQRAAREVLGLEDDGEGDDGESSSSSSSSESD